ncbi:hypothetical protein D3Y59_14210 [Hymenobacter oligotrophus]|uniref:Aromatic hydrocarbon degradation protein n=1 Tax=Hymenobacter oligotrophus TaxID=2319843 RepID=A0A3B7R425_9BACT|nr:hypothetical protein [Hymenobacter oligotrophus]AYA38090.1 hypothetical protein D3Y59_14210 [Hymenobacter oligotrophus]
MKQYFVGLALLGLASPLFAQSEADALRYSRLQFGGTARTQAIGGANVAVGADLNSLSSNPAGLGLYQRSEFTFSPGLGIGNANAQVTNAQGAPSLSDGRNSVHVANAGLAFVNRRPDSDNNDWRGGTLAFGFTRINDFNASFRYRSNVADNRSLFQRFREPRAGAGQSLGDVYDDVDQQFADNQYATLDGLAYGAYLVNYDRTANGNYVVSTPSDLRRSVVRQEETVLNTGSQTQFDVGYGGSYRDKLYVGGALGIVSTRFNSVRELREVDEVGGSRSFGSLLLRNELETRGSGFNVRLGVIYRPLGWLRVGASAQSPTAFQLDDTDETSLDVQFKQPIRVDGQNISSVSVATEPDLGRYSYRLSTPWRLNTGAAAIIGKYGFVSADVEMVDYGQARLRSDTSLEYGFNYSFGPENDAIRNDYQRTFNVRVGGEARLDAFRLRLGYANYGDPYRRSDFDRTQQFFTGGVGLRQKNLSLDLAGVYSLADRYYSPYTLSDSSQPVVQVEGNRLSTTLTLGLQF